MVLSLSLVVNSDLKECLNLQRLKNIQNVLLYSANEIHEISRHVSLICCIHQAKIQTAVLCSIVCVTS